MGLDHRRHFPRGGLRSWKYKTRVRVSCIIILISEYYDRLVATEYPFPTSLKSNQGPFHVQVARSGT